MSPKCISDLNNPICEPFHRQRILKNVLSKTASAGDDIPLPPLPPEPPLPPLLQLCA
jgi:hypothetical protein